MKTLTAFLLLVMVSLSYSQFKSWTIDQTGYWFYSKADDNAYKAECIYKQVKYMAVYLILPDHDTIQFTQVNNKLKPIREYCDIRYLGSGKSDHTEITKDAIFIHFRTFNRKH